MSETFDVVIIGAGTTGLAAADRLVTAGLSVRVLEARDRVGGRLLSGISSNGPVDLGATWFWPGEHRVAALVERFGIAVHPQHLAGDAMYQETSGAQRLDGNPIDVPSGRFVSGAQAVTEALADALPSGTVLLKTAASSVAVSADGVTVDAVTASADVAVDPVTAKDSEPRSLVGRHVIVALPPALAAADLQFEPPLPDRLAGLLAATPVWMGAVTKVVAVYDQPFWRKEGLSGSAISHIGPMREIHDMSGPDGSPAAIFGFVPGTGAGAPTVTDADVRHQLGQIFGPQGADPAELHIQDWRQERWTSPPDVERMTAYQTYGHALFREPVADGRLFFASTETATESPGHIEGALAAAERAVTAILAASETSIGGHQPHREQTP